MEQKKKKVGGWSKSHPINCDTVTFTLISFLFVQSCPDLQFIASIKIEEVVQVDEEWNLDSFSHCSLICMEEPFSDLYGRTFVWQIFKVKCDFCFLFC